MPAAPPLPITVAQMPASLTRPDAWEAVQRAVAMAGGPGLLVLPEGVLNGYFPSDPEEAHQAALPHRALQTLSESLSSERAVLVGFTELKHGQLYNSCAVLFGGKVLGVARKQHGTEQGFSAGLPGQVFKIPGLRFGILICRDARFADSADTLAASGAQVLAVPLNNLLPLRTAEHWRSRHLPILQARAVQTGCWVASADVVGQHGGAVAHGCSAILSPKGGVQVRVPEGQVAQVSYP